MPATSGTHVPTSLAYLHELDTVLVQRGLGGGRFFGLEGFHPAERDGQGDGTFRWSTARASLTIPGGEDVALTVTGGRPVGAPPAEIVVRIGRQGGGAAPLIVAAASGMATGIYCRHITHLCHALVTIRSVCQGAWSGRGSEGRMSRCAA